MKTLTHSEVNTVNGGGIPLVVAATWLGRAGAVGSLIGLGYYFYNRQ